jgi:hypothetical protein
MINLPFVGKLSSERHRKINENSGQRKMSCRNFQCTLRRHKSPMRFQKHFLARKMRKSQKIISTTSDGNQEENLFLMTPWKFVAISKKYRYLIRHEKCFDTIWNENFLWEKINNFDNFYLLIRYLLMDLHPLFIF